MNTMTETIAPDEVGVTDFTEDIKVKFRINDDMFIGKRNIPGKKLVKFAAAMEDMTASEMANNPETLDGMLRITLAKDSAERFIARMDDDDNPISLTQVMRILPWLMEQYGMRPTEPSPSSPDGQPSLDDGTNSTVNVSAEGLTSVVSPLLNS